VNVLCKFSDVSTEPHEVSWFDAEMSSSYPGLDHYWRQLSEDRINLAGTASVGWYMLPQPRSYYVYDRNSDGVDDLDHDRAVVDCTGVADNDVFFPDFVGINLMFNADLDCCAWGGSRTLNIDGQTKTYRVTWEPPWGYENQGVLAHEMGHGFGLPHSSGPYDAVYDSRWDVMSSIFGNCPPHHSTYGCIGVHTISYHKDLLAWIPAQRKYTPSPGSVQAITLERLGEPTTTDHFLVAQIPIDGSPGQFYTVEARRLAGYDATLPSKAVVLHRVDPAGGRPARVVDPDGNGDPNDAAAIWLPGETFRDEANLVAVTVESETATGFVVTIEYRAAPIVLRVGNPPTAVVPNEQVALPIVMDMSGAGSVNIASIQFQLFWDPARLTYVETVLGPFGSVTLNEMDTGSGTLGVALFNATGSTSTFTVLTLVQNATATEGYTPISANVTVAGDEMGVDILPMIFVENLDLCVGVLALLGDVNDDGAVNIIDAQQVARHAVGLPTPGAPKLAEAGDVTEDGNINIIDAQQIARYSIGLDAPAAPNIEMPIAGGCQ
jgi:hypothetical protein